VFETYSMFVSVDYYTSGMQYASTNCALLCYYHSIQCALVTHTSSIALYSTHASIALKKRQAQLATVYEY
jgi:hypothetical protein